MALALYSPPLSPQQPAETSPNLSSFARRTSTASFSASSMYEGTRNSSSFYTGNTSPVEQKEDYNSYTSSTPKLTPKTIFNHAPNYNPSFIHSPHYTPSYTYYYEKPTPADPLAQSHGTLHFIQGLFKLVLSAIIFGAAGYIMYRIGVNFSHDIVEKMNFYESGKQTFSIMIS